MDNIYSEESHKTSADNFKYECGAIHTSLLVCVGRHFLFQKSN